MCPCTCGIFMCMLATCSLGSWSHSLLCMWCCVEHSLCDQRCVTWEEGEKLIFFFLIPSLASSIRAIANNSSFLLYGKTKRIVISLNRLCCGFMLILFVSWLDNLLQGGQFHFACRTLSDEVTLVASLPWSIYELVLPLLFDQLVLQTMLLTWLMAWIWRCFDGFWHCCIFSNKSTLRHYVMLVGLT